MVRTPLELPGWVDFNVWRTGLKAQPIATQQGGGASAIFYLDHRGRVRLPPNNAYLPIVSLSNRDTPSGRAADWHRAAAPLVEEMASRGVVNQVDLPPEIEDVRPWIWRNFVVGVRYTHFVDFPFDEGFADRGTRRSISKAVALGLTATKVLEPELVTRCLAETEKRQGLSHQVGGRDLEKASELLGAESLRMYVCTDSRGRPLSSAVMLHEPRTRAIAWLAGTDTGPGAKGAAHLLWRAVFEDLSEAGADGVDLCGGLIPSVSAFKARMGGRLVVNYSVRTPSLRAGARALVNSLRFAKGPVDR